MKILRCADACHTLDGHQTAVSRNCELMNFSGSVRQNKFADTVRVTKVSHALNVGVIRHIKDKIIARR